MRRRRCFGVVAILGACLTFAGGGVLWGESIEELADRCDDAANQSDAQAIEGVVQKLEGQHPTAPGRYARAFCVYRLAGLQMGTGQSDGLADALARAQELLDENLDELDESAQLLLESMSLQAGIVGLRIGLQPGLGMRLGPRSSQLLAKAARLGDDNPRVHLQNGISKMNTPRIWGGSVSKAEAALRKAVALFSQAGDSAPWPNWGRTDALIWLGQSLAAQDKIDEARAAYQQALALDAELGWVRYELLPALEGKKR